jgi:transposase
MTSIPKLGRAERRRLIRLGRRSRDPATSLRFLMIARLAQGPSRNQVARELGCAVSTVVAAAQRYVADGVAGLYDRRAANGKPKVNDPFREQLRKLLYVGPQSCGWRRPTWTRELLVLEMERRGFPKVAACTMGRALAAIGAKLKSPRPVVICPWGVDRQDRRLRQIRKLVASASADEPVLYSDEVDIHLNPRIGHDWMPRGFQRYVLTPGNNVKHYLAGALDVRTGELIWVDRERKDSALFCALLWRLATRFRRARRVHLILDNYGVHSSKMTQRCLESLGGRVVLHFLPPYSPEHNKIERAWQDLHANVTRNHTCRTMKKLLAEVFDFLHGYRAWRARTSEARHLSRRAA